jgi:hypothetical protein
MSGIAMLGMTLVSAIATIAIGGYDILNGHQDKKDSVPAGEPAAAPPVQSSIPESKIPPLTGPAPPAHVKKETTQDADERFASSVSSKISRAFPKIEGKDADGATYDSYSARVVNHVCNKDTLEFDDGQDGTEHLKFMAALVLLCRGSADLVYKDDKDGGSDQNGTQDKNVAKNKGWQRLCWANKPIVILMRYGGDYSRSFYEIIVHHARERQTFNFTCSVNGGDRNVFQDGRGIKDLLDTIAIPDVKSMVQRYSGSNMYSGPVRDIEGRDDCLYTLAAIVLDAPDWRDRIDDEFKSRDFMEYVSDALKEHGINTGKYDTRRPGINEEPKKDKDDKNKKQNKKQNNNNNGRPRRPDRWDPVKKKWVP